MKIIAIFLVVGVIYYIIRELSALKRNQTEADLPPDQPETIKPCLVCGVHLPETDGLIIGQEFFCSEEHQQEHLRKGSL